MASFRPINTDENPNKKLKVVDDVDTRTSPPTVVTSLSPSLSVFSIDTNDNDTYTYTPPGASESITVDLDGVYPSDGETMERYLGPQKYWKERVAPSVIDLCNNLRTIPEIPDTDEFEFTDIKISDKDKCVFVIHVNYIPTKLQFEIEHNVMTNETKLSKKVKNGFNLFSGN